MKKSISVRVIAVLAMPGMVMVGVVIAQVLNPPFTLTISPVRNVVKVGDEVKIQIALKNTSSRPLPLGQTTTPDFDFNVTVFKSDGTPPPDTERGHALRDENRGAFYMIISQVWGDLGPDLVFIEKGIDISNLYDLSSPGQYTVQVQRTIPKGFGFGVVKSNTIMITVEK